MELMNNYKEMILVVDLDALTEVLKMGRRVEAYLKPGGVQY